MLFLSRIRGWFSKSRPAEKTGEAAFAAAIGPSVSPRFGGWTSDRNEQICHYKHWVYRAVNSIATQATKSPLQVALRVGKSQQSTGRKIGNYTRKKSIGLSFCGEVEYADDSHPLVRLLSNPNGPDTGVDFWFEVFLFLELTGSSYVWIVRDETGRPASLWVLPSNWVWPVSGSDSGELISHYEVRPAGVAGSGRPWDIPAADIVWIRYKSPLSKFDGQSPLAAGDTTIDTYELCQFARFSAIRNGANVGPTIEIDATINPSQQQLDSLRLQWRQKYSGPQNFGAPPILPPGVKLNKQSGDSELAFVATMDQLRDYVLGLWGITKSVVGIMEDVNRAAFEAALLQFFELVIIPRQSIVAATITEKLACEFPDVACVYWENQSPRDRQQSLAEWRFLASNGCVTINEVRREYDLEPIDGGEKLIEHGTDPDRQGSAAESAAGGAVGADPGEREEGDR